MKIAKRRIDPYDPPQGIKVEFEIREYAAETEADSESLGAIRERARIEKPDGLWECRPVGVHEPPFLGLVVFPFLEEDREEVFWGLTGQAAALIFEPKKWREKSLRSFSVRNPSVDACSKKAVNGVAAISLLSADMQRAFVVASKHRDVIQDMLDTFLYGRISADTPDVFTTGSHRGRTVVIRASGDALFVPGESIPLGRKLYHYHDQHFQEAEKLIVNVETVNQAFSAWVRFGMYLDGC